MAYDVNKNRDEHRIKEPGNPYESALTEYSGGSAPSAPAVGPVVPTLQVAQGTPQRLAPDSGPSATGYVNFDRLYNANAGVAQREAGKRASAAEQAGQKAVQGRTGAQQGFANAARTGATQGPTSADYNYASGQRAFYAPPQRAQAPTSNAAAVAPARGNGAADMMPAMTEEQFRGRLAGQSRGGYSGPDAMSKMPGYDDLLKQTVAAEQQAENPLAGLNQTDAALIGAAGRPRFAQVASQYGNLKDELDAANTASIGEANAARASGNAAAGDYERLLSEYEAKKAADEAAAEANKPKPIVIPAAPGVGDGGPTDVSPEVRQLWETMPPETKQRQHGADKNFEQITGAADRTLDGVLNGTYGISLDEAAAIKDVMTPEDWAEYQRAAGAHTPDLLLAWIRRMQAKARAG